VRAPERGRTTGLPGGEDHICASMWARIRVKLYPPQRDGPLREADSLAHWYRERLKIKDKPKREEIRTS
jgi:hypothetical protein